MKYIIDEDPIAIDCMFNFKFINDHPCANDKEWGEKMKSNIMSQRSCCES